MDLFIFDSTLTKVQSVLTELELIEAVEERELGKAGQLTFTIANEYANSVKELNIVAVPVEGSKVRLYVVSNKAVEADTTTITAISYPNYFLSRVGYVKDLRPKERPLKELIPQILGDSGFTLNKVDSSLAPYTGSFYYISRLEALSQISETIACEFDLYATISKNALTGQYVDVVSMLGSDTGKRFEYGSNALEVVAEYDATEVYSQAIGRGKGEESGDGYGRRIEFTEVEWKKSKGDPVDKPKGQNWVNDPYGNYMLPTQKRALKILEFEEIEDPAYLLSQTYSWLINNNRPKVQFKASVTEVDGLELGDRVQIVRSDLNLRYTTRVFSVKRNLLNESLNEISLGDNIATTPMDKLNSITNKIDAATDTIQRVEQQVAMVDANGVRVNYGKNEPSNKKPGDIWYKEQEDGSTILLQWNGEEWERVVDDKLIEEVVQAVDSAVNDAESAKNSAQQAVDKAGEIEKNFNTEIGSVKIDISNVNNSAQNALQQAQSAINKADFNNSEITKIQKQQTADSQRLTTIESNYNGLQTTVVNLQNDTNSRFNQFSDLINANVSKIENNKQQISNVQQSFNQFQIDVKKSDVDNLFVDSEFYDINKLISNRPLSNVSVLGDETYVNSRILHWKGKLGTWAQLQFQRIIIPSTLSTKVTVGFNYRFPNSASKIMASFYFKRADGTLTGKREEYLKADESQINKWLSFSMTGNIPDGTAFIDFLFNQNGTDDFEMSRPRLYAGSIDWGYNANTAYSQAQIKVQADRIEETVQNQDVLNKRVQTAEGTIESIENMTGSNTIVNTVKGQQQQIQDASGNALNALKTAQGVQTTVYNTGNIWMTPDFQTTPLSKYTNTSDTDGNVRIVTNGVPNSATEAVKYNQPYKKRNNSNKSIRFEGRTDGNRDCFQKEEYNIQVAGGDRFDISFDFYKTPEGSAGAGFKLIAEDGSISWIALYAKQESHGSWWHIDGQIEVPSDKQYIKAQAFISYGKVSSSSGQYCYMDNISIKKVTGSNYAQYSTITQTIEGIQTQVQDNEGNISKVTQTAQGIVSSVNNIQSVLGPTYPNGSFIDKDFNKYYTAQNSVSGATATIPSDSDFLQLKTGVNAKASAMLTDYIEFDMNKPIEFRFKAYFNNTTYDKPRMYVHEYDKDYKEVRNGNDSIFKGTDKAGTWYEVKKSWIVDKTNKPKYFRVEWVCWDNGSGNNELRIANASLSNGQANIGTNITQLQDDINLRVKKGDVITQINLDSSGVLIDGAKNHITGQTTIDNAVIKSSMIDTITANKITTGTLNAANVKIINLDVNSLTGNLTQFVQTQWNSVNSGVSIDGNGLKIKASSGENILLNNGTFQFRDSGNKEIIGISRFSNGSVNLAVRKGERFSISYDGEDSTDNAFASALSFHGTTGSITFNSQNIWFQDRELRFTTMDWGNGRIPSIRNTDNVAGIGLGSKALYFGDSVGILTLDNIRNGKLNKITFPDGRALTLQSGTISGTKVGYLVGTNDVGIAWSGGDLYFNNNYTSGWIKFNDILKKLGFV